MFWRNVKERDQPYRSPAKPSNERVPMKAIQYLQRLWFKTYNYIKDNRGQIWSTCVIITITTIFILFILFLGFSAQDCNANHRMFSVRDAELEIQLRQYLEEMDMATYNKRCVYEYNHYMGSLLCDIRTGSGVVQVKCVSKKNTRECSLYQGEKCK